MTENNKKPTPNFLVWRPEPGAGFFSNLFFSLDGIAYARLLGWRPIVDMQYHKTNYSRPEVANDWEAYFKQPSGGTVDEVRAHKHRENAGRHTGLFTSLYDAPLLQGPKLRAYRHMFARWIHLQPYVLTSVQAQMRELELEQGQYLAVHYRGTDMLHTANHPRTSGIAEYIDLARRVSSKMPADTPIFLATDDAGAVQKFREVFETRVRTLDAARSSDGSAVHLANASNSSFGNLGVEVLVDACILGRGAHLVAGRSNVAQASLLLSPKIIRVSEVKPTHLGNGQSVTGQSLHSTAAVVLFRTVLRSIKQFVLCRHWSYRRASRT
jgi:hypothetical protein